MAGEARYFCFARMNSQLISTKHMYTALQLTCGSYDKS